MEKKKKLPLPLLILLIGAAVGVVFCGIGLFKQFDAKRINEERYNEAYKKALDNKKILEKRYKEIAEELEPLKNQYDIKRQECDGMSMTDPNWFANNSKCQREATEIDSQINKLETEQFQIENYDNTVYYNKVKPMSYLIFYIIGGSIFGVALLVAFIIYLVKGKKTYN